VIGENTVDAMSARELYLGLGLASKHWSKWARVNIEENSYFLQGVDFIQLSLKGNGDNPNPTKDFAVSIRFGKHIAMQAKTKKSHEYRDYFIECEKKAITVMRVPQTFAQALRLAAEQQEIIERKDQLIVATNQAQIAAGEILVREFVKANDLIDCGEKQFWQWMRDQEIVSERNEPYQKYVNRGFFTYKPTEEMHGGKFRYTLRITPRGKIWLANEYLKFIDEGL
jgi:phage anti-repressor protein